MTATFNARKFMSLEIADYVDSFGDIAKGDFSEYMATANKIQKLFNSRNVKALEAISENNEDYSAMEQRCADMATFILQDELENA